MMLKNFMFAVRKIRFISAIARPLLVRKFNFVQLASITALSAGIYSFSNSSLSCEELSSKASPENVLDAEEESGMSDEGTNEAAAAEARELEKLKEDIMLSSLKTDADVEALVNNKQYWEDKKSCHFCKTMLESPCGEEFKRWDICVGQAKLRNEDFVQQCSSKTISMVECMYHNEAYFTKESDGGNATSDSTAEPPIVAEKAKESESSKI